LAAAVPEVHTRMTGQPVSRAIPSAKNPALRSSRITHGRIAQARSRPVTSAVEREPGEIQAWATPDRANSSIMTPAARLLGLGDGSKGGAPDERGQLIFSLGKFRFGVGSRDDPGAPEEVHRAAVDNAGAQRDRELTLAFCVDPTDGAGVPAALRFFALDDCAGSFARHTAYGGGRVKQSCQFDDAARFTQAALDPGEQMLRLGQEHQARTRGNA